jgi:hypothetical protein
MVMTFMEKVEAMDPKEIAQRPAIKAFWEKSLCWSLAHRRSFKYPAGTELPRDDYFNYESKKKELVPLSEVELALLCWAGAGTNGLIRNDRSFAQHACTHPWFEGRVYPSACNVWYAHLLFANDEGVFLYKPHVPTRIVEVETQQDMEIIFKAFKEGIIQLSDQSIMMTERSKAKPSEESRQKHTSFGSEFLFMPGVTNFFPVLDITVEMINALLMLYGTGTPLFDEETGKAAGIQKWSDRGILNDEKLPLRLYETGGIQLLIAHQYYIHQNLQLCAAAMGLGGYVTGGGYNALTLLSETLEKGGHGFRFEKDKQGYTYPVGIDNVIETHMPPYMSMENAVQDVWDMKFKKGYGRYNEEVKEGDEVAYPGFDPNPRAVHRPFLEPEKYTRAAWVEPREAVQIAKDVANYIYDTYGRFPRLFNPVLCEAFVQTLHIELDFYDRYLMDGSLWTEQREHMRNWHE